MKTRAIVGICVPILVAACSERPAPAAVSASPSAAPHALAAAGPMAGLVLVPGRIEVPAVPVTDADGDGVDRPIDCDDQRFEARPGADEIECNGMDEDCDGVDLCPPDDDGDGIRASHDCDDTDPTRSPFASEVHCDGIDQNCDGIDWCDADNDGFPAHRDCDDGAPGVHPRAADTTCDGVDQNCDGADCCGQDTDGDGADCAVDCDDLDATIAPGLPDPCDGVDRDCDGADASGACSFP